MLPLYLSKIYIADAVVMDCSSNCESLKTVSAAKLWLAVKKHADTTQEGHLVGSFPIFVVVININKNY